MGGLPAISSAAVGRQARRHSPADSSSKPGRGERIIGTEAVEGLHPTVTRSCSRQRSAHRCKPILRRRLRSGKSFAPVRPVGDLISGLAIHPAVGLKTFKDMIDYARPTGQARPTSAGLGNLLASAHRDVRVKAGIDVLHVPYRGSADALNDLLAQQRADD